MRKDVRTGAAIGGILIAVIVLYAIVASRGHTDKKKNQIAIDPGNASRANDNTGAAEHPADAEQHIDLLAPLTHGSSGDANAVTAGASIPGNHDAVTPPSAQDNDPAINEHHKKLLAAMNGEFPSRPIPEHVVVDIPGGGDAAGSGLINAVDHQQGDVPAGDATTAGQPLPGDNHAGNTHRQNGSEEHPATPAPSKTHRIESGETFSSIARAVYGDAKYYKDIIKANPSVDPTHLKPGMVITLPEKPQSQPKREAAAATHPGGGEVSDPPLPNTRVLEAPARAAVPASIDPRTQYRVQNSDSLYKISIKLYKSPNRVDAIYQLNKDQIGSDPAKLKLNMVLKLPEPPTQGGPQ